MPAQEQVAALRRTARRYRACGRFARYYIAGKLRGDPVYMTLLSTAAREPFGSVLDVGCGRGQLGIALLDAGVATTVYGFDRNRSHLEQARKAAATLPFYVAVCDLSHPPVFPDADTVLLIDVCYQLDTDAQIQLLHALAHTARSRILIRAADPDLGVRSGVTLGLELLGRRVWPHSGTHVNMRPLAEIEAVLRNAGFITTRTPCWKGTPFANTLLTGRRLR